MCVKVSCKAESCRWGDPPSDGTRRYRRVPGAALPKGCRMSGGGKGERVRGRPALAFEGSAGTIISCS